MKTTADRSGIEAQRGDSISQAGQTKYLRFIRVKHLTAATGDDLADAIRAWFIADSETYTDPVTTVEEIAELSEDRELIDWEYRIGADAAHHVMILYAE